LILRRRRDILLDSKEGKETADFGGTHLPRMTLSMEQNISFDPVQVRLFRSQAVVVKTERVARLVHQAGRSHDCLLAVIFNRKSPINLTK
jgi:hypothetical protein